MELYDFPVSKETVFLSPSEGATQPIPHFEAIVRKDTNDVLGIVSEKYKLRTHGEVINAFRTALEGQGFEEKIQLAKNGAQLFATYKLLGEQIEVGVGDFVSLQFVVKNSYDGSSALQIMLGAYRLVCSNGMVIGKSFYKFSQRHIGDKNGAMDTEKLRGQIFALSEQFRGVLPTLQKMSNQEVTAAEEYLFDAKTLQLPEYIVEEARAQWQQERDKNVWGFYNSLTHAITHSMRKESPASSLFMGQRAWKVANNLLLPA